MIATHKDCGSKECEHRDPHPANAFCQDGQCRWSSECQCVPESTRERVEALIKSDELTTLSEDQFVDRIMDIFEEKEGITA
jgi:hypothetical protein